MAKTLTFDDIPKQNETVYELQPDKHPSTRSFNANCRDVKGKPGKVECVPRHTTSESEEVTNPELLKILNGTIVDEKTFLEAHRAEAFLGVGVLILVTLIWWTLTRPPPLRNNLLIGGATIGAFVLNPIAGAIVLAAWIFKAK